MYCIRARKKVLPVTHNNNAKIGQEIGEGRGVLIIEKERCKGCQLCIGACPRGCLKLSDTLNKRGVRSAEFYLKDRCTGCALCAVMCPDVCIEVKKNS
ncbi:MAG: 4Fe-4S binding protein [Candidatus Omnitrophica bacterium]|nr:4Fe-4S binding protein [Candidatus Omnitrophota bacterium]